MKHAEPATASAALPPHVRAMIGQRPIPELVRMLGPCPEETLASLIESDGRERLERGLDLTLDEYLAAIPTLNTMTVALDAAIDMALRALAGASSPTQKTVEALIQKFPNLETAIREAAMLGHALHTAPTPRIRTSRYAGKLPCDIGPNLPDGRPQYVLQRLLGRGAFGEVYLAQDRHLSDDDRPALVAIKVLVDDPENLGLRYRLADEATKARRVDHPNVVRVIARAQSESGDEFVVYEYVEGPNLQDHVRRLPARMSLQDAARMVVQIARGIHAAHSAGLVHRDLKPGNVLIDAAGKPRITDFGVAVRERSGFSPASSDQSGQAGTLAFMAPEQFSTRLGAVGPPADVFALAGILVWLVIGRPPYGSTPDEITKAHLEASTGATPTSLDEALQLLDPTLRHIARRSLDSKPERRYASASEFADELTCWLELRPVPSMNLPAHARVALWARRRPGLAATTLVALLTIIIGSATTIRLRTVAQRKAEEARIAQIRVEEEEKRRNLSAASLSAYSKFIESTSNKDVANAIGLFYIADEKFGPGGLNVGDSLKLISEGRLRVARKRLAASRSEDGSHTFESAYWLALLSIWNIEEGRYDEPIADLREAAGLIAQRFPDDPWLASLATLEKCARVNAILDAPVFDRDAATALADEIEHDLTELASASLFSVTDTARRVLDRLYAPRALNRQPLAENPTAASAPAAAPAPAAP